MRHSGALCVSIHDVAPRTLAACKHIAEAVRAIDGSVPLTLLVVPCYHGDPRLPAEFVDWIGARIDRGDELALHGYTHRDEASAAHGWREQIRRNLYTAREGEFAALSREEAAERIERGRRVFAERGWPLQGFVAPAWLVSPGTWDALNDCDFLYTTTLSRFHVLKQGVAVRAPSIVYSTRSAWRRSASRAWNASLSSAARNMPLVRVGFHPSDADHPDVMAHALALLRGLLRNRTPKTKSAFARGVG